MPSMLQIYLKNLQSSYLQKKELLKQKDPRRQYLRNRQKRSQRKRLYLRGLRTVLVLVK